MLSPALAELLRQQRPAFNARFAAARRRWPHLEAADFSQFLRDQLSPVIEAVPAAHAMSVATIGYDIGLQLVAEKLAGPAAASPAINTLWSSTFPSVAPLIARAPRPLLGSLCNAAQQLAVTPGCDVQGWSETVARLGPLCADVAQVLALGQLLAWRAGLAHYRLSALAAAAKLPATLALAAVRAPATADWTEVLAAHQHDPWFSYPSEGLLFPAATATRRVGAFRGFGGLFTRPPTVTACGDHLLVRSGEEAWVLVADACGATFHRAAADELNTAPASRVLPPASTVLPPGHSLTSAAVAGNTLAATSAQSHAVWVGPKVEGR